MLVLVDVRTWCIAACCVAAHADLCPPQEAPSVSTRAEDLHHEAQDEVGLI